MLQVSSDSKKDAKKCQISDVRWQNYVYLCTKYKQQLSYKLQKQNVDSAKWNWITSVCGINGGIGILKIILT